MYIIAEKTFKTRNPATIKIIMDYYLITLILICTYIC